MSRAKPDEPIEMPFGQQTSAGQTNCVLDEGAHWRYVANTIERPVRGGDATLCQITLIVCLFCTLFAVCDYLYPIRRAYVLIKCHTITIRYNTRGYLPHETKTGQVVKEF